jgi:hypothetical protein
MIYKMTVKNVIDFNSVILIILLILSNKLCQGCTLKVARASRP